MPSLGSPVESISMTLSADGTDIQCTAGGAGPAGADPMCEDMADAGEPTTTHHTLNSVQDMSTVLTQYWSSGSVTKAPLPCKTDNAPYCTYFPHSTHHEGILRKGT